MDDSRLREIPFHKETIYEGSILHVEKWQVTCPNGHSAPREIVVHKGAAAVVPVYEDGTTTKQLSDIPIWIRIEQELAFLCHRYECRECGRDFTEEIPLKYPGTRITERAASWMRV